MNLVHAQEARRALDRVIGWRVSGPLSNKAGKSLSAGRVQSPAVYLVVQRERTIRGFKPTQHYGATLRFVTDGAAWSAQWQTKPHLAPGSDYLVDQSVAAIAAGVRQCVSSTSPTRKPRARRRRRSPRPRCSNAPTARSIQAEEDDGTGATTLRAGRD
jgi:DNA topoisomerase-1